MKKILTTLVAILAIGQFALIAQTARLQAIHNSPDPLLGTVDVYVNGALLPVFDDFDFREATPYLDVPAGTPIVLGLALGNSTSYADTLTTITLPTLATTDTVLLIVNGLASDTTIGGNNPDGISKLLTVLTVPGVREAGQNGSGFVDLLVHHGSPNAPTVDIQARNLATLINNISYNSFVGYAPVPVGEYVLDVTDSTGGTVVASYYADLTGVGGGAATVFASGIFGGSAPTGKEFGIYVALPDGTVFPLPALGNARAQVIHNAADAAAATVDIYIEDVSGNTLYALDDVDFRTATAFVDVPTNVPVTAFVAPSNSTSSADAIASFPLADATNAGAGLKTDETYVIIANGIVSGTGYTPSPAFGLDVYAGGLEAAATSGNASIMVYHGSTDAPTVDIYETTAGELVNDISYSEFSAGYLDLPTADYSVEVRLANGTDIVQTYSAPLSTLNLADQAMVVLASGFLDPSQNSNGAAFGLWVALPAGGALVELPVITSVGEEEFVQGLVMYPNPTSDFLRINYNLLSSERVIFEMYNTNGQLVKSMDAGQLGSGSNNIDIDVQGLAQGNYLLNMRIGNEANATRIVSVK